MLTTVPVDGPCKQAIPHNQAHDCDQQLVIKQNFMPRTSFGRAMALGLTLRRQVMHLTWSLCPKAGNLRDAATRSDLGQMAPMT